MSTFIRAPCLKFSLYASTVDSCKSFLTVLVYLAQVQQKKPNTHVDPPNLVQMVSYCKALATPVAMMQSEFQPVSSRIGQAIPTLLY